MNPIEQYNEADRFLHQMTQPLAAVGKNLLDREDDDSHTSVTFDGLDNRLLSNWVKLDDHRTMLTFNIIRSRFEWIDDHRKLLAEVPVEENSLYTLQRQLNNAIASFSHAPAFFDKVMHYEIPEYDLGKRELRIPEAADLKLWSTWRRMANNVCFEYGKFIKSNTIVRIWPHHFDTAIQVNLNSNLHIGLGWAMADDIVKEPYFYLVGHTRESEIKKDKLDLLPAGEWKVRDDWNGAVLPMSGLMDKSFEQLQAPIIGFLKATTFQLIRATH